MKKVDKVIDWNINCVIDKINQEAKEKEIRINKMITDLENDFKKIDQMIADLKNGIITKGVN